MKRNLHLSVMAFIATCTVISISCKKSSSDKSRSELLVGNWMLTSDVYSPSYDYDGDGTTETEAISLYESCDKDDFITFNANNTGSFDEGATKCDINDDQAYPLGWQLSDNDSKITIVGTGVGSGVANILQLDNSTFKISATFEELGTTYTNTQTFKRK